jgi:hypothetical protein
MLHSRKFRHAHLYAIALSVFLVLAAMSPALAKRKAFGEVTSFDGVMLTVSMGNGGTLVAPVADDVQIKVEHRSNKGHAKHSKKPSDGTVADLLPGAKILRIKIKCSEVVKLRISRVPAPAAAAGSVVRVTSDEPTSGEDGGSTNPCDSDDDAAPDEEKATPPTDDGGEPEGDAGLPADDGSDDSDSDDDGGLLTDLPIL